MRHASGASAAPAQSSVGSSGGRDELMTAMDRINAKYGHGSLYLASAGTAGARREWLTRRSLKTPEYNTRLADLPVAVL